MKGVLCYAYTTHAAKSSIADMGGNPQSETDEEAELTLPLFPAVDVHAVTGCPFPCPGCW